MYVSNIKDIGHRYMNYFYLQVLQGSCVGNIQLNCSKRVRFLDLYCQVYIQPVYKCCYDPKAVNEWAIDQLRTQSTVQRSFS